MTLPEHLRLARERCNLSQAEVAALCGLKAIRISQWECGDREPTLRHLVALANAYGIGLDELVGRESPDDSAMWRVDAP